ncbi:MAG TPA: hypothetical protein VG435_19775 [Acidimicrobiales bacterium]|jgi:hypothetical protein|nr:hypothetical protein [Acidimicrobiales bacterium]
METQIPTDAPAPPPYQTTRSGLGQNPALPILAGALALLLVVALVLSLLDLSSKNGKVNSLNRQNTLRQTALQAANKYGIDFASYNYADLHGATAPWTLLEAHSTAKFMSEFKQTSSALQPSIVAYKVTAAATIPMAAVSSLVGDKAIVMLQVSQKITNSAQGKSGAQTVPFLVVMTLQHQKGQWNVDNVQVSISG